MALTTYAELKQAIQDYTKRPDSTSMLDTFIDLAESDIWERLRIRDMESRTTSTATTRYLALPTGFVELRRLSIVSSSRYELEYATPESLRIDSTSGVPKYFTITSQIEFDRVPDTSYSVEFQYYASLTALSNSNTSNAVLSRFPMVYLYGSCMHLALWALDLELFNSYSMLFNGAIEAANKSDKKGRYGKAKAMRIEGSTP